MKICTNELISSLYHPENYENLFEENELLVKERNEIKEELSMLRQSLDILNDIEMKF